MAMYTNAKVNSHPIKLIFDIGLADSIITKQLMNQLGYQIDCAISTKIITANKTTKTPIGEINNFSFEELELYLTKTTEHTLIITASHATKNAMVIPNDKTSETINHVLLVKNNYLTKKYGTTFLIEEEHVMPCVST
ncbi:hypothetical protein G9A89_002801 [Geosiphon pyriformis]|nr:hypothetical protein G9A89_002801 [Geosiphon pyriformis]